MNGQPGATDRCDPSEGIIMRRRRFHAAVEHRDLSWFGRARAALADVGRPDLIGHLRAVPGPDPRFPGGYYPEILDSSLVLPLEDRKLLHRAVLLAVAEWPYHRSHYPRDFVARNADPISIEEQW